MESRFRPMQPGPNGLVPAESFPSLLDSAEAQPRKRVPIGAGVIRTASFRGIATSLPPEEYPEHDHLRAGPYTDAPPARRCADDGDGETGGGASVGGADADGSMTPEQFAAAMTKARASGRGAGAAGSDSEVAASMPHPALADPTWTQPVDVLLPTEKTPYNVPHRFLGSAGSHGKHRGHAGTGHGPRRNGGHSGEGGWNASAAPTPLPLPVSNGALESNIRVLEASESNPKLMRAGSMRRQRALSAKERASAVRLPRPTVRTRPDGQRRAAGGVGGRGGSGPRVHALGTEQQPGDRTPVRERSRGAGGRMTATMFHTLEHRALQAAEAHSQMLRDTAARGSGPMHRAGSKRRSARRKASGKRAGNSVASRTRMGDGRHAGGGSADAAEEVYRLTEGDLLDSDDIGDTPVDLTPLVATGVHLVDGLVGYQGSADSLAYNPSSSWMEDLNMVLDVNQRGGHGGPGPVLDSSTGAPLRSPPRSLVRPNTSHGYGNARRATADDGPDLREEAAARGMHERGRSAGPARGRGGTGLRRVLSMPPENSSAVPDATHSGSGAVVGDGAVRRPRTSGAAGGRHRPMSRGSASAKSAPAGYSGGGGGALSPGASATSEATAGSVAAWNSQPRHGLQGQRVFTGRGRGASAGARMPMPNPRVVTVSYEPLAIEEEAARARYRGGRDRTFDVRGHRGPVSAGDAHRDGHGGVAHGSAAAAARRARSAGATRSSASTGSLQQYHRARSGARSRPQAPDGLVEGYLPGRTRAPLVPTSRPAVPRAQAPRHNAPLQQWNTSARPAGGDEGPLLDTPLSVDAYQRAVGNSIRTYAPSPAAKPSTNRSRDLWAGFVE